MTRIDSDKVFREQRFLFIKKDEAWREVKRRSPGLTTCLSSLSWKARRRQFNRGRTKLTSALQSALNSIVMTSFAPSRMKRLPSVNEPSLLQLAFSSEDGGDRRTMGVQYDRKVCSRSSKLDSNSGQADITQRVFECFT